MSNIVRIESITIQNFKNIKNGHLNFDNSKKNYAASILGLYGQNGSGKTALIDALELLRLALSGKSLPPHFANFINVDSESATIKYALKIQIDKYNSTYDVVYELSLRREIDDSDQNMDNPSTTENYKAIIVDEILSYSYEPEIGKRERFATIIDTRTENDKPFVPVAKYNVLVGKSKETLTNLIVAKQLARAPSRSFIFSKELVNIIRKNCQNGNICTCMNVKCNMSYKGTPTLVQRHIIARNCTVDFDNLINIIIQYNRANQIYDCTYRFNHMNTSAQF